MSFDEINAKLNRLAKAGSDDRFFMVSRKRKQAKPKPISRTVRSISTGVTKTNAVQLSLF